MALSAAYAAVRQHSLALAAPLSAEDCAAQSMPDASPVKWHLAHTTWFYETFVLGGRAAFHPAFRMLFNSYYHGVGARHPRPQRGLLTRPDLPTVLAYRADVDRRMQELIASGAADADLLTLGLQHEQQHQELILTDVLHLFSQNPLAPAYGAPLAPAAAPPDGWLQLDGGLHAIGHAGAGFCFDNELPRHHVHLAPYALARRLVTQGEFLAFVEAGGYRDPALWLSEGWDRVQAEDWQHPLYWRRAESGGWQVFGLGGLQALDPAAPLLHVSLYEADAYARWAGARLPTEAEWEAASGHPGLAQLADQGWQWTSSSYAPYPGFAPAPGAVGEYNGKFMVNQYVLRGGSRYTPPGHARPSYRNFFPAGARWQCSAIRLAR
ncbi:ergothioneine biosynthesis protein EgtB [Massilia sp. TS11]|uniref:ergothioneine biosynthesis protein EgtB n=1 Tax=Massilia sp. TS11 TaxID=2908003 RepID=UPI001EDC6380|nr:ergothioneine biosynthesis protein EgtB [Massilia sp. TS11]MCG2584272.1 ergothioneine biosynthesis protein EgtB [Massilia sp. TS11]